MSFEQMQSTMQFILEQQAQYSARLQNDEERISRIETAFVTLTELARNTDERLDSFDRRMNALDEHLKTQIESLHAFLQAQSEDFYARLAADKAEFESLFQHQRSDFDRHFHLLVEQSFKSDKRLDRLSSLVEQHLTGGKGTNLKYPQD